MPFKQSKSASQSQTPKSSGFKPSKSVPSVGADFGVDKRTDNPLAWMSRQSFTPEVLRPAYAKTGQIISNIQRSRNAFDDNLVQGVTGGFGDELIGLFNKEKGDKFKRNVALARMTNPVASNVGGATGAVLQAAGGGAVVGKVAPKLGVAMQSMAKAKPILYNSAMGAAQGALTGSGEADSGQRLQGAQVGAIGGGIGGAIGGGLIKKLNTPKPKVPEDVRILAKEGVQMTRGQMKGGLTQDFENKLTSTPFLGNAINKAQQNSYDSFNRALVNRALKPMGLNLPKDVATGNQAIGYAQDVFNQKYDELLPEIGFKLNPNIYENISNELNDISQEMTPDTLGQLQKILNNRLTSKIVGKDQLTGQEVKQIQSSLNAKARQYMGNQDPTLADIGEGLSRVTKVLRNSVAEQNPIYGAELAKVDKGYSRFADLQKAAGTKAGVLDGIVTPKQMMAIMRSVDKSVRGGAVAAGNARDQAFYNAAAKILPNNVPDSGTAGRNIVGGAIGGSGITGFFMGNPAALAGATATGGALYGAGKALYSPNAIQRINNSLLNRIAKEDSGLGQSAFALPPQLQNNLGNVLGQEIGSTQAAPVQLSPDGQELLRRAQSGELSPEIIDALKQSNNPEHIYITKQLGL